VALPVTSARRSPQPTHAINAPRHNARTSAVPLRKVEYCMIAAIPDQEKLGMSGYSKEFLEFWHTHG